MSFKCNLIIPGFAKCGTTSMHEYLDLHPEVVMSSVKEPHFFSIEERWERGVDFHNSLFEGRRTAKYYGESSTTYAVYAKALERIKECLQSPKLIVLLRDPVERTISHYRWLYAVDREKNSFHHAFMKDLNVPFNPNVSIRECYRAYRRFSNYSVYVPLIFSLFGKENVHLVDSDHLKRNPQEVVNQCFKFLELTPLDNIQEIRVNKTDVAQIRFPKVVRKYKQFVPQTLRRDLRKVLLKLNTFLGSMLLQEKLAIPEISAEDKSILRDILGEDIAYYENTFKQKETC